MDSNNKLASTNSIELSCIEILKVIDRGSYGTVKFAKWNGIDVAVKVFETPSEKEAFYTEIDVLSGVRHVNIIEFFGICIDVQNYIVMELANQGSLYYLLHKRVDISYTTSHMLVWWLEISEAISYLHNLRPKPIIHRDLKSSNLLLKDDHIKVCDFGTACDIHTLMSNAKGTVAWMAPEVITSTTYNELCDVYSFGICMWELLMRKVPFKGRTSFQIMSFVTSNKRLELPSSVPFPIKLIFERCCTHDPSQRPSMASICKLLEKIWNFFHRPSKPTTPQSTPGPSVQPSPPRFPVTPASCTPSPTVAYPSTPSSEQQNPSSDSLLPYQPASTNEESCRLYAEHLQVYEEYQVISMHLKRKRDLYNNLMETHRDAMKRLHTLEAANEGRELRLSILKSKNESLDRDLNFALDN